MKKIIAFIMLFVFLCFKCFTWVPTAAATGIPAFDALYYAILQTMGMAYTNGVEMDLAPVISDIRQNIPDYLQQPDVALKYLLREYAGKVWDSLSQSWVDAANDSPYLNNTAAIRIAGTDVSTPTLRDIVSQYQTKALNLDYDITTPIDSNAIAFWNKYNSVEINNYLNKLNYSDNISVIPQEYVSYIEKCNLPTYSYDGFFWGNFQQVYYNYSNNAYPEYLYFPLTELSYHIENPNASPNQFYYRALAKSDIYITENLNGTWTVNCNTFTAPLCTLGNRVTVLWYDRYSSYIIPNNTSSLNDVTKMVANSSTPETSQEITFSNNFGDFDRAIDFVSKAFRNVNIYVNNELWSLSTPTSFSGSVPNAVIDNSTDDGKIVSNPIYWVVDNNTGLPIDSQINLDKLIDYLKGIIDGTNDDTSVDFGDLVDAGVIEKQDGTVISDTDVIAVPVADVIDDAIADSDALDIPVAAIGDIPPLPDLPPFFPTPDFPDGDPTSGFHGMSVLARIINITNQSLPDDIIIVFYGVIFGAVVLGLIKILHK